eukprot:COSAG05_NODE_23800_length_255_cov_1.102564_1_plen_48_part_01
MAGIGGQACRLHVLAACLKPDFSANVWLVLLPLRPLLRREQAWPDQKE